MEQKAKKKMEFLLSQLRVDVTRDAEMARSYFILLLIRALTAGKTSTDLCIRSTEFQNHLQRFSVEFFALLMKYQRRMWQLSIAFWDSSRNIPYTNIECSLMCFAR